MHQASTQNTEKMKGKTGKTTLFSDIFPRLKAYINMIEIPYKNPFFGSC